MNRILLIISACFLVFSCDKKPDVKYDLKIEKPFVHISPDADTMMVKPSESKVFRIKGGSSIEVPAWAFVDENGDTVKSEVQVVYKEMKSAADIVASGIPMTVEDSGRSRQMESAGMFELNAYAEGAPVFLGKDKKLIVNMASDVEGSDYDFYYLEPGTSVASAEFMLDAGPVPTAANYRWKEIYSTREKEEEKEKEKQKQKQKEKQISAASGKKVTFKFNQKEYPETELLESIDWKLADNSPEFDPGSEVNKNIKDVEWNRVSLNKTAYRPVKIRDLPGEYYWHSEGFMMDEEHILEEGKDLIMVNWEGKETARYKGMKGKYLKRQRDDKQLEHIVAYDSADVYLLKKPSTVIHIGGKNDCVSFVKNKIVIGAKSDGYYEIIVMSLEGKAMWSKKFDTKSVLYSGTIINEERRLIGISTDKGIEIYDIAGNNIATLNLDEASGAYFNFSDSSNYIKVNPFNSDQRNYAWDFVKNKKIYLPEGYSFSYTSMNIVEKNRNIYYWDDVKNTVTFLVSNSEYYSDLIKFKSGIYVYRGILYNKDHTPLFKSPDSNYMAGLSSDKNFFLLRQNDSVQSKIKLYNTEGVLIRDFTLFDPGIMRAEFFKNEIMCYTGDGKITYWNYKGELIRSEKLRLDRNCRYMKRSEVSNSYIIAYDDKTLVLTDSSGRALSVFGGFRDVNFNSDYSKMIRTAHRDYRKATLFNVNGKELPANSYQLDLSKEKQEFTSYVNISSSDLDKYYQYKKAIQKRQQKESERQAEEAALVRSFEISNMGIYNWDRIYKDEDALIVKLTLKGELPDKEFSSATLFHITGANRTTVIKYYLNKIDSFAIKTAEPNQLMVVLGDGRIATVEEAEFKKIDVAELKRKKVLKLEMKVKEKPKDVTDLAKLIQ